MLTARDVSFSYVPGRPVLSNVSLNAGRHDVVGLLGPNGSGKTTLMRILGGVLSPGSGAVTLGGTPLAELPRRAIARRLAVVPQETHPTFDYSVLEIVLMGRYPHLGVLGLEGPDDLRIARDALVLTGTAELEARLFHTLSGGEKQRVAIAAALAQSPELLLLDEPTAALDLGHQLEVAALLARLNREAGVTMVLSTHDLNFAASLCGTLVMLRDGKVVAAGPTDAVLTADAVRALYGVDAEVERHPRARRLVITPIARSLP